MKVKIGDEWKEYEVEFGEVTAQRQYLQSEQLQSEWSLHIGRWIDCLFIVLPPVEDEPYVFCEYVDEFDDIEQDAAFIKYNSLYI